MNKSFSSFSKDHNHRRLETLLGDLNRQTLTNSLRSLLKRLKQTGGESDPRTFRPFNILSKSNLRG